MVVDQLLADLLVHASQGVVGAGEVTGQLGEGALHQALNSEPLVLGDAGGQSEPVNAPSNSDTGGMYGGRSINVPLDLGNIHVAGVLAVSGDAMVVLDDGVEHVREDLQYKYLSQSDPSCSDCSAL